MIFSEALGKIKTIFLDTAPSGKHHAGVLILRLEDADGETKVEITKKILAEYYDKIESHFCVFQNGKLRIRG